MPQNLIADFVLLFVTLCWGITFPLIENSVHMLDPFVFVMMRFFLATLVLLPFVLSSFKSTSKEILIGGMILGALNAFAYSAQTIGLQTVTAAEGAFITGISVVIVPFVLPLFSLGMPTKKDVLCSFLCLTGLFFLESRGLTYFNTGVLWILLCAFVIAITIVYLQKVSSKLSELALLAFYQIFFTAFFCLPWSLHKNFQPLISVSVIVALLFCAIFATSIALLLQTKFQHYTTANRAAMIFCFEPVFGAVSAYFINDEILGKNILFGGLFIFLGISISLVRFRK